MTAPTLGADDRAAITEVLTRYATGIDTRDWDLFRTVFTADVDADYGKVGAWRGVDEITDVMTAIHEPCGATMHRLTNIVIAAAGPDRAQARTYVNAIVMGPDDFGGVSANGFYDDELVRTSDGWRIARRRYTEVHTALMPERLTF